MYSLQISILCTWYRLQLSPLERKSYINYRISLLMDNLYNYYIELKTLKNDSPFLEGQWKLSNQVKSCQMLLQIRDHTSSNFTHLRVAAI